MFLDPKAYMGQSVSSDLEHQPFGAGAKSKFITTTQQAQLQHKKPYFKNEKPLPSNFSSILE